MNQKGAEGEAYAADVLESLGYRILARNFSSRYGEVDLIAQNGEIIAFVEVKTRKAGSMTTAASAVTRSKQRKIIATALWYMQSKNCELQPRFDVFCVTTKAGAIISYDYLEGAFDGEAFRS